MTANPTDPALEIKRLQRCMNNLVSVLALPAMWSGGEPSRIIHTLVDALLDMLQLDLIYVQSRAPGSQAPIESIRVAQLQRQVPTPHEIGNTLKHWLGTETQQWPPLARGPLGDRDITIVTMGLGLQRELGVIVAGSERADFPSKTN